MVYVFRTHREAVLFFCKADLMAKCSASLVSPTALESPACPIIAYLIHYCPYLYYVCSPSPLSLINSIKLYYCPQFYLNYCQYAPYRPQIEVPLKCSIITHRLHYCPKPVLSPIAIIGQISLSSMRSDIVLNFLSLLIFIIIADMGSL